MPRLENDRVRVVENTYPPGSASPLHTHYFPRTGYFLSDGRLALISNGDTTVVDVMAGLTVWRPAETHVVANVGTTTVRVLETEIKQ